MSHCMVKLTRYWDWQLTIWLSTSSQFDSNILQLLGIPGRILVPPVIQLFRSKLLHFLFQWWGSFFETLDLEVLWSYLMKMIVLSGVLKLSTGYQKHLLIAFKCPLIQVILINIRNYHNNRQWIFKRSSSRELSLFTLKRKQKQVINKSKLSNLLYVARPTFLVNAIS